MKHKIAAICLVLILSGTTTSGQTYEPLELAKKLFGRDSIANIDLYITGEYNGRPNGQDLIRGTNTTFLLLSQTETRAVVAMTILDTSGKGLDTYLHFEKSTTWKMSAFRALALTGMIEQAIIELEKMTQKQIDEIISKSKEKKKDDFVLFSSQEDYNFQLGNAKLTIELDDNIIKHFKTNQVEFERLKDLAEKEIEKQKPDKDSRIKLIEQSKADYQKLYISSVSTGGYELGICIDFLIGGVVDNSVGYLYVKDKKDLIDTNSDRVIMLREIGNGWYIYKTT